MKIHGVVAKTVQKFKGSKVEEFKVMVSAFEPLNP